MIRPSDDARPGPSTVVWEAGPATFCRSIRER